MKANSFYQKVFIVNDLNANKTTAMSSIFLHVITREQSYRERKKRQKEQKYTTKWLVWNLYSISGYRESIYHLLSYLFSYFIH